jgi:predicted nucleotide-binding protein (sugar kinase/HSP70/actin superfamily)
MTNLITANDIEETEAYKSLQEFQKSLIIKRDNREILEQALIHHKVTGEILPQIGQKNIKILTEIIEKNGKQNST